MAEPRTKSFMQRLRERRAAIESGDPTGGESFDADGNRRNREAVREQLTSKKKKKKKR